jgi:hypothetical protein
MTAPTPVHRYDPEDQLEYWLRRAEQESIAAIRASNAVAAERHDAMAFAYSSQALAMLDCRDRRGSPES